jgi:hypothetical protein
MHTIRLRRPWRREVEQGGAVDQGGVVEKADVPDSDPVAAPSGTVVYRRSFNCPSGLESGDRVWLHFECFQAARASVELNTHVLLDADPDAIDFPLRLEVTEQLTPSNQLTVRLEPASQSNASIDGEVSLQIVAAESD